MKIFIFGRTKNFRLIFLKDVPLEVLLIDLNFVLLNCAEDTFNSKRELCSSNNLDLYLFLMYFQTRLPVGVLSCSKAQRKRRWKALMFLLAIHDPWLAQKLPSNVFRKSKLQLHPIQKLFLKRQSFQLTVQCEIHTPQFKSSGDQRSDQNVECFSWKKTSLSSENFLSNKTVSVPSTCSNLKKNAFCGNEMV